VINGLPTHCCAALRSGQEVQDCNPPTTPVDVDDIVLEDQAGRQRSFDDWFADRPTLIAFFYTRCPNPNKCSATVAKLADLQRRLAAAELGGQLRLAAITYDPGFDNAERMRRYGESHGLQFDENAMMLRSLAGIEPLRRAFDLRVGYVGSIVNRHAIELFLTAPGGNPIRAWTRTQWSVDDVLDAVTEAAQ
jgi:protein SCO1/2